MYWQHFPQFFDDNTLFEKVYDQISTICKPVIYNMYGKRFESKRLSCIYADQEVYSGMENLSWEEAPKEIIEMRRMIEENFGKNIDYVLVHIYRDGLDKIAWHCDKEAMNSDIFSVSLGATRRFIMKDKVSDEKTEFRLKSGDLFHMLGIEEGKKVVKVNM